MALGFLDLRAAHNLGGLPAGVDMVGRYNRTLAFLATDLQWAYVRRLMNEAFCHAYSGSDLPNIDVHHMPTYYTKAQASFDIKTLINIKARGWK